MSLAIWDATRHKCAHPALTPAIQAGTRFTYPGGIEGWVDLGEGWVDQLYLSGLLLRGGRERKYERRGIWWREGFERDAAIYVCVVKISNVRNLFDNALPFWNLGGAALSLSPKIWAPENLYFQLAQSTVLFFTVCGSTITKLSRHVQECRAPSCPEIPEMSQMSWNCPEISSCPEILLIWSECPDMDLNLQICCHQEVASFKAKCTKFDFGWGSAADPAGGAYSTPPGRPLDGFELSNVNWICLYMLIKVPVCFSFYRAMH